MKLLCTSAPIQVTYRDARGGASPLSTPHKLGFVAVSHVQDNTAASKYESTVLPQPVHESHEE